MNTLRSVFITILALALVLGAGATPVAATITGSDYQMTTAGQSVVAGQIGEPDFVMVSGINPSVEKLSIKESNVLTGGQYRLSLQTTVVAQTSGYRLFESGTTALPGLGCCCKNFLTCIRK
jgi:hypothetical protein